MNLCLVLQSSKSNLYELFLLIVIQNGVWTFLGGLDVDFVAVLGDSELTLDRFIISGASVVVQSGRSGTTGTSQGFGVGQSIIGSGQ